MNAVLLSAGLVFIAELGDKSQLMSMTFATRFRARTVIVGSQNSVSAPTPQTLADNPYTFAAW